MDRYLTETSANLRCARRVDSAAAAPYIRVLTDAVSWPAVIQLRSRTNRLICIQETRDRGGARNMTKKRGAQVWDRTRMFLSYVARNRFFRANVTCFWGPSM